MLFGLVYLFTLVSLFLILFQGVSSSQTLWPAAVPLAVRSPYFSAWQNTTVRDNVADEWPQFWNDNGNPPTLGWAGMIRVDGTTYKWLGQDTVSNPATAFNGIQVTPTRTIYSLVAGPMDVTVTFLTPIEPSDWVRQSIPFSYVSLNATANDGKPHAVQVYSDVSAEWVSGNRSALVQWSTTSTDQLVYHQVELQTPSPFTEILNQAEDGTLYYSMAYSSDVTYQTGRDNDVRSQFATNGALAGTQDTDFRAINYDYPVFGIAVDLGSITSIQSSPVWSVGYVRNPSIKYTTSTGEVQLRSPYYVTQYATIADVIGEFVSGFTDAMTGSIALDNQLTQNASAISAEYSELVSLAARQAFGGIDITVGSGSDGGWNTSDVMIFMKNLGYGNSRVNPVEIIYAAFPMFLYLNASYGKPLLAPLLEYQDSSQYTLPYAASDLGTSYPVASGDNSGAASGGATEGVEQSGNMLIMALAHARATGDGSLIDQHYNLFKSWTGYLVENSQTPTNQQSADGQTNANMTNLAIKGIIGIKAMSEISQALVKTDDAQKFASTAATYVNTWQSLAFSSQQNSLLFSYGQTDTWALMYNLYADRLLGTNLVDESTYEAQTTYYQQLLSGGSGGTFGLPVDSAITGAQGNSAWTIFTAASVSNTTVRDNLISMAWTHASSNLTPGVFPSVYDVDTGDILDGYASPAQGAMFAPLALSISNKSIKVPVEPTATTTKHVAVGAIVGGVVGGVAGLAVIVLAVIFWRRSRQRSRQSEKDYVIDEPAPQPFPYEATPFVPSESTGEAQPNQPNQYPPFVMSSKMREYLSAQDHRRQESVVGSSEYSSSTLPSSREPPSTVGSDSLNTTLSPHEIIGLRTEVENLRRVMQELHAERLEAPPVYEEA